MTGIEQLRKLGADAVRGGDIGRAICDIADQIEREHDAEVADSPYDAILPEGREALAWVRDHGGLESVKERLDWVVGHCSTKQQLDFDFWLSGRVMHELGFDEDMADRDEVERRLLARLMPEGMEWLLEVWPRWSNGEYCRFGDWWTANRYGDYEPRQLRRLVIYTPELLDEWEQGDGESYGYEWDFMRPSELDYRPDKVEPPAPSVPAADGEPLEAGQTVWKLYPHVERVVVKDIYRAGGTTVVEYQSDGVSYPEHCHPSDLTHTKPEHKRICGDCRHWQGDPSASHMGVCFNSYRERCCVDSYEAQLDYAKACEDFEERGE